MLVVAAAGAALAGGPDDGSPARFVSWIYSHYPTRGRAWPSRGVERGIFSPSLEALIAADRHWAGAGEVGAADDGDRFCQCQDDAGLQASLRAVRMAGPNHASASVSLRFSAEVPPAAENVVLDLVRVDRRWRVDDVHGRDEPSFRATLAEETRGPRDGPP